MNIYMHDIISMCIVPRKSQLFYTSESQFYTPETICNTWLVYTLLVKYN